MSINISIEPMSHSNPKHTSAERQGRMATGLRPVLDILAAIGITPVHTHPYPETCLDRHNDIPVVLSKLPEQLTEVHHGYPDGRHYHSAQHALAVANIAWTLMARYSLSDREQAVVLLAAMYHDVGHSVGEHNDNWNVNRAVSKLRADTRPFLHSSKDHYLTETIEMACNLIQRTVYKPGIRRYEENLMSNILRDADMLYATVSIDTGSIIYKLTFEQLGGEYPHKAQIKKAYKDQVKFLTQLEFFTPEAQHLFGKNLAPSLRDLRHYIDHLIGQLK